MTILQESGLVVLNGCLDKGVWETGLLKEWGGGRQKKKVWRKWRRRKVCKIHPLLPSLTEERRIFEKKSGAAEDEGGKNFLIELINNCGVGEKNIGWGERGSVVTLGCFGSRRLPPEKPSREDKPR